MQTVQPHTHMTRTTCMAAVGVLAVCLSSITAASVSAQNRPAIQALGPVLSTSSEISGSITNIRALPGGLLLVNSRTARQVLLMDSTFTVLKVVADSTPGSPNPYGAQGGSLIAYRGDSTLFVDPSSLSMLVIDPDGNITRVMSVPRSQDAMMLTVGGLGVGGAQYSNGHLVYRGMPMQRITGGSPMSSGGAAMAIPDTMPILRVNLQTRVVDTLGFIRSPRVNTSFNRGDDGSIHISIEVNPLPTVDEWAVTSNGDVALVRGRDFHIDWIRADGQSVSSPKIQFDWKRLTDEDKVNLIDSVKAIRDREAAANPNPDQERAMVSAFSSVLGAGATAGAGATGGPVPTMRIQVRAADAGGGGSSAQISAPVVTYVSPSDLPDYQPPFFATSVRPDADGNIWIQTIPTKPEPAGTVFDVINSNGEATARILIPEGRRLVGFGPGGVVFLANATGSSTTLERARVIQ